MTPIELVQIDHNLAADIVGSGQMDWALFEAPYEHATVGNQRYQVVFSAAMSRGGVVFCGSGSSGHTAWTDAASPDEVLRRFLEDDMAV